MPNRIESVTIVSDDHGPRRGKIVREQEFYTFGGYMVVSMNAFLEIRKHKLSAKERELLDYLMLHVEFGNVCVDFHREVCATELETAGSAISRSLSRLEKCELVSRGRRGVIYLNPNFWFKGSVSDQKKAVFKWHKGKMAALKEQQVA